MTPTPTTSTDQPERTTERPKFNPPCACGRPSYRRGNGGFVCKRCDMMEGKAGAFHDVLKGRVRRRRVLTPK